MNGEIFSLEFIFAIKGLRKKNVVTQFRELDHLLNNEFRGLRPNLES